MRILKDKDGNVLVANGKVAAATASLDPNIVPGNIKKNVKILGVTGNYGGGGDEPKGDVTFIDYDGSVVCTYTTDEFLNLSEMPANPTHEGLVAQGWNWSLEDAQIYVDKHDKLIIGQMYTTDDGATRIYISVNDNIKRVDVACAIREDDGYLYVDWGDGSTPDEMEILSNSISFGDYNYYVCHYGHEYDNADDYVISVSRENDDAHYIYLGIGNFESNSVYNSFLTKFETGDGVDGFPNNAFSLSGLESISLSKDIIAFNDYCFESSQKLKGIVLPEDCKGFGQKSFSNCIRLRSVSLSPGLDIIRSYTFAATDVDLITIPDSVNSIGDGAFSYSTLQEIVFPDNVDFVNLENCIIECCAYIKNIDLPNTLSNIYRGAFADCMSLTEVTIPESVTSMGENLFSGDYDPVIRYIHMLSTNPPEIEENTFLGLPSDTIIYVPVGYSSTYKNAQYWSGISSHICDEGSEPEPLTPQL